jgi:hypothetical protein
MQHGKNLHRQTKISQKQALESAVRHFAGYQDASRKDICIHILVVLPSLSSSRNRIDQELFGLRDNISSQGQSVTLGINV